MSKKYTAVEMMEAIKAQYPDFQDKQIQVKLAPSAMQNLGNMWKRSDGFCQVVSLDDHIMFGNCYSHRDDNGNHKSKIVIAGDTYPIRHQLREKGFEWDAETKSYSKLYDWVSNVRWTDDLRNDGFKVHAPWRVFLLVNNALMSVQEMRFTTFEEDALESKRNAFFLQMKMTLPDGYEWDTSAPFYTEYAIRLLEFFTTYMAIEHGMGENSEIEAIKVLGARFSPENYSDM
jgi:hypothetical protein